ncbi:MAG: DSD1 family PLP-dependent enzyme [Pseudomonadota bacterium]
MTTRPPADIGMALDEVDTPALLIELDAFERNLRRLAEAIAPHKVALRPHAKTHKSPVIALQQIALGAVGVCCQKVSEAEAMVAGGVADVLVTNQIVGGQKLRRLAALARRARIAVCADDDGNVEAIDAAAKEFEVRLPVLVEINLGANRCGVEPGEPALRLAARIASSSNLGFGGLQAYLGPAQHVRPYAERRDLIARAAEQAASTKEVIERNGIPCPTITGAGTGSFEFEAASGVYTELQCGSYVFMDADYARNLNREGTAAQAFEHSLFVLATVMSRTAEDRAVVDAGLKAVSVDSGFPLVDGYPEAEYVRAADEHGRLQLHRPTNALRLGDKVRLIPGHCDPTVNLYDWYVGVRRGRVEALWPVAARGAGV